MSTINTEFEMKLDREDGEIDITVNADGEIDYKDPSVGIFHDGIGYVYLTSVTGENGNVELTQTEKKTVEDKAHDKLLDQLL